MPTIIHDLHNNVIGTSLAVAISSATATNGASVDCINSQGRINVVVGLGATLTGAQTHTFTAQESDTGSGDWTAVTNVVNGPVVLSTASSAGAFSFDRTKRYVRVVDTSAGTVTASTAYAVVLADKITF